jgi:hypothetical protein
MKKMDENGQVFKNFNRWYLSNENSISCIPLPFPSPLLATQCLDRRVRKRKERWVVLGLLNIFFI